MASTYTKASISTEAAHGLIAAAETKAGELGKPFAIPSHGGHYSEDMQVAEAALAELG